MTTGNFTTINFTTVPKEFPEGTVAGAYNVTIIDSNGVPIEAKNTMATSVLFNLQPGTYQVSVQLLADNGIPLGYRVLSDLFTIDAPIVTDPVDPSPAVMVEIQIPSSVTVIV